ncbi:MAG: hypothetical protein JF607_17515 [Burkholderiales bacterium]|nr:hypothetical protein [Burkholderiales bacterium]
MNKPKATLPLSMRSARSQLVHLIAETLVAKALTERAPARAKLLPTPVTQAEHAGSNVRTLQHRPATSDVG